MHNRRYGWRRALLISTAVLALLIGGFLLWYFEIVPPPELSSPPSWRGITPGQTTLDEALETLGYPDESDYREGSRIYRYEQRTQLGWEYVELWVEEREDVRTVYAIVLAVPYGPRRLSQFVVSYGRPDEVTWSLDRLGRVLIWARSGVTVQANGNTQRFGWNDLYVSDVMYYEPMGVRRYLRAQFEWPWRIGPIISARRLGPFVIERNLYTDPRRLDFLPEDPYDWEHMP